MGEKEECFVSMSAYEIRPDKDDAGIIGIGIVLEEYSVIAVDFSDTHILSYGCRIFFGILLGFLHGYPVSVLYRSHVAGNSSFRSGWLDIYDFQKSIASKLFLEFIHTTHRNIRVGAYSRCLGFGF